MVVRVRFITIQLAAFFVFAVGAIASEREEQNFDFGWKFHYGEAKGSETLDFRVFPCELISSYGISLKGTFEMLETPVTEGSPPDTE